MKFVIQSGVNELYEERFDLKELLSSSPFSYTHEFIERDINSLDDIDKKDRIVPVGTIQYIKAFYGENSDSMFMKPVEIPKCLRCNPFVVRDYHMVHYEDLPKTGRWFFKTASLMKGITGLVINGEDIRDYIESQSVLMKSADSTPLPLWNPRNIIYQISEVVDFVSEYRVFISDDEVKGVMLYNGDPLTFPDSKLINDAIIRLKIERMGGSFIPRAYTLDVMVRYDGETEIVEIHNFVSCGTYRFVCNELPYMYLRGVEFERERISLPYDETYYV